MQRKIIHKSFSKRLFSAQNTDYTAKKNNLFWPNENSNEQCFAANIVQGCQQYCSTLLRLIAG